jgi:hypothetical protein
MTLARIHIRFVSITVDIITAAAGSLVKLVPIVGAAGSRLPARKGDDGNS